jgi:glutaredoxin-related protein
MSGLSVALLFAYLAVRPIVQVTSADGGRLAPEKERTAVKVESVRQGDLTAKMQAKNQCVSSNGWRVLFGFYVTASAWRKSVRNTWTKTTESGNWEVCVREGLKLAKRYGEGAQVYVSAAAQCEPGSPLLTTLQHLQVGYGDTNVDKAAASLKEFWKIVASRKSVKWVNSQLRRFLTVS